MIKILKTYVMLCLFLSSLLFFSCSGDLFNETDDSYSYSPQGWTLVKAMVECTSSQESWCNISFVENDDTFFYMYSLNIEHWNHKNIRSGSISSISPETATYTSNTELVYNTHPYSDIFNFRVASPSVVLYNDELYASYYGNSLNIGSDHSLAVIKSTDSGATWEKHQLLLQNSTDYSYFGNMFNTADGEYIVYYIKYNKNTSACEYNYILSNNTTFNTGDAQVCDELTGKLFAVIKRDGIYYGFYGEVNEYDTFVGIRLIASNDPSFTTHTTGPLIVEAGISTYDAYSITPSFHIKDGYIYMMAIVDPRMRTDYGFDNDSYICLYKRPLYELGL